MSKESNLEFQVGGFVLLALGCLLFFIFSISDFSFFEKGYTVKAVFTFANGLKTASPVRFAGVEAGRVKTLKVFTDKADGKATKVMVDLWIKEGIEIPEDSRVAINQLGLLGEKYVEIMPGHAVGFVKAQDVVVGADPVPVEKITEQVFAITQKFDKTLEEVNTGILNDTNKQTLSSTLQGISDIVADIKGGRGTVGKLLADESIYTNLEELTLDLKANPWKLLYRPRPGK